MLSATLTSKGQITIPKTIRQFLHCSRGDQLEFRIEADGTVRLLPAGKGAVEVLGMLASRSRRTLSVAEMDARLSESFRKKWRRGR